MKVNPQLLVRMRRESTPRLFGLLEKGVLGGPELAAATETLWERGKLLHGKEEFSLESDDTDQPYR